MEKATVYEVPNQPNLLVSGAVGGVIAGIIFAVSEMLINVLILGRSFVGPLRLISTIVLGRQAVQPTYPLATAVIVGVIFHLILAALYGIAFVYLLSWTRQLKEPPILLLIYGTFYGLLLWVLNFLVIAPAVFPQFTNANQFWNGFVAHTFFFGTVLGIYTALTYARREPVGETTQK